MRMNARDSAKKIFTSAVKSVHPGKLISDKVLLSGNVLSFPGIELSLGDIERIFVVGAGKATASMANAIEEILGDHITGGHIVVKYNHSLPLRKIHITEAGHPFPDHNGYSGTREVLNIANSATETDLVICLLSGGGSSLLADFPDGSGEEDMEKINRILVKCGADIHEMNTVRKHLSKVKGGQLARAVYPAILVNIMLSDVPGDNPDIIASGPAFPDPSFFADAVAVISKYGLADQIPGPLMRYLEMGMKGIVAETPKPGDPVFTRCFNFLAGNNESALAGAKYEAVQWGFNCMVAATNLQGSTELAASQIVDISKKYKEDDGIKKPACLLFGGETTIKVTGHGLGGRNQHLALLCSVLLRDYPGITVLAAGTDGSDGPTDAAGAVVDSDTYNDGAADGKDAFVYIDNFDSYSFFSETSGHIKTGPTMTNVMDIAVVIIE